jgi:hypothetical protein
MSALWLIAIWLLIQSTFAWKIHVSNSENGMAEFEEGSNSHLSCSVKDLPEGAVPEIYWIGLNSQKIKSRFMVWHDLSSEHEGKYKCVVNVDGEESVEIIDVKIHSMFKCIESIYLSIKNIPSF